MLTVWLGKTKRIERLGLDLAVLVTIVMLTLFMVSPYVLVRLENTSLDARFVLRGSRPAGHEVKLVLVDEPSIRELGRWPWSRDKHARLIEPLSEDGAKVIAFDFIFSEAEVTENLKGLREISQAAGLEKKDRKSTRLNSSHDQISYAVFCLKKKNTTDYITSCIITEQT